MPHILAKEVSVAPLDKRSKINAIPNSIGDHSTKIHSTSEEMTFLVQKAWAGAMTSKLLEVDTFSSILTN